MTESLQFLLYKNDCPIHQAAATVHSKHHDAISMSYSHLKELDPHALLHGNHVLVLNGDMTAGNLTLHQLKKLRSVCKSVIVQVNTIDAAQQLGDFQANAIVEPVVDWVFREYGHLMSDEDVKLFVTPDTIQL